MNGLHIPGTPLVVDFWRQKNVPPRALFFLTHMHADHTCGLTSNWPYPIHCTPLTARLLHRKFKLPSHLIVELEVGESRLLHVTGPSGRVSVSVTVLDANHCPGSAMFLFEGYFGKILYTGDFRYSPSMSALSLLVKHRPIDTLYLDNTYCEPSCIFPPREIATEEILKLICGNSDGVTILGLHTLGKEDLLVAVAKQLGMWVGVSPERFETLRLIDAENVFTTDVDSCFVRVLPFNTAVMSGLKLNGEEQGSTLVILPTCVFTGGGAKHAPSHPSIKVVAYSDHSSFDELTEFVGVVRPKCIHPIVRSFSGDKPTIMSSRCNMSVFDCLLDPTPQVAFEIPQLISQRFSVCDHGNRPHPSAPAVSVVRQSLGANERIGHLPQCKRASGVKYLSPRKESSDSHVTTERTENETVSYDCHVIEGPEIGEKGTNKNKKGVHFENTSSENSPKKSEPRTPKPCTAAIFRHTPSEPRTISYQKSVLDPVVRVLSEPRRYPSLRSDLFYGTEQRHRKRSRSSGMTTGASDTREEGCGARREIPSTVTRPLWETRMEREWGVVFVGGANGEASKTEGRDEAKNGVSSVVRDTEVGTERKRGVIAAGKGEAKAHQFQIDRFLLLPDVPELPPLSKVLKTPAPESHDSHLTSPSSSTPHDGGTEPKKEAIFDFLDKMIAKILP